MKYLNLGCGNSYSLYPEWTNIDFVSGSKKVMQHNLLNGIPFQSETFDLVYHSHVLEHFIKEDAEKFISECFRVLKAGGILRIAVPDLERIVREYLKWLEKGIKDPDDNLVRANYEWILNEMYDQTVRNKPGGNMGKLLLKDHLINEAFVYERIGEEAKSFRKSDRIYVTGSNPNTRLISKLKNKLITFINGSYKLLVPKAYRLGKFRLGGEVHYWMYDIYSLAHLLRLNGGNKIQIRDAFSSYIVNWKHYELDGKDGIVRKPDSIFIEAVK